MPVNTTNSPASLLEATVGHGWWWRQWASPRVAAGITDRTIDIAQMLDVFHRPVMTVGAEQVHGSSIAIIDRHQPIAQPVPGCDALLTHLPGVALLIRTADCLPIFFADATRSVVGLAHVGWRGLGGLLPMRVVAALHHAYHTRAEDLHVAIGPSIRACCYDVDEEFATRCGSFVQRREGRLTCDLIGMAIEQLRRAGIRADRIVQAQRCTACETDRWFSLRKEGAATGRLTSLIMVRP